MIKALRVIASTALTLLLVTPLVAGTNRCPEAFATFPTELNNSLRKIRQKLNSYPLLPVYAPKEPLQGANQMKARVLFTLIDDAFSRFKTKYPDLAVYQGPQRLIENIQIIQSGDNSGPVIQFVQLARSPIGGIQLDVSRLTSMSRPELSELSTKLLNQLIVLANPNQMDPNGDHLISTDPQPAEELLYIVQSLTRRTAFSRPPAIRDWSASSESITNSLRIEFSSVLDSSLVLHRIQVFIQIAKTLNDALLQVEKVIPKSRIVAFLPEVIRFEFMVSPARVQQSRHTLTLYGDSEVPSPQYIQLRREILKIFRLI